MIGEGGDFNRPTSPSEVQDNQETMVNITTAAATTGHVVSVGRGGQVLLVDKRDVLHVGVVAPPELRVAYTARREELDTEAARRLVQAKYQARKYYMQTQYQ
jgi:hypothetical protein